ncbi:glycosyltransferase family 2 protein [Bacteroides sp. GD17]|jgi:glycosyltransferase involved in cell wall biosynthesis|uniref:glycosyltransferase family 2 protein n=1 Tax=Bacteroides sp. GD17 TaxID=3139826 RepID=UPI0025F2F198|nr:glycosyltransferase family 2 protein [uncultured Bacteroides sp.]
MLSVICPIYNEAKYIDICVQSILLQDFPKDKLEVLFVDGISTDGTRDIINSYSRQYSFIHLLDNERRIVPVAMNIGIKASKGDVIMRLDAHAQYPPNYFSALVLKLYQLNADNVGTICRTDVLNKTPKTLAIRTVLGNKLGVGNSTFRLGIDKVMEVDTVPFGCWKRDVFEKYGFYDERLIRNQDIELNKRIAHGGGHIFIVPDTYCTYLARETFKGLAKNNFGNGRWNVLTVYYTKQFRSLSVRHFIPLLFLLSLFLPLLFALFYTPFAYLPFLFLSMYLLVLSSMSLYLSISKKLNAFYLLTTFVILHVSYGYGSLVGILNCISHGKC